MSEIDEKAAQLCADQDQLAGSSLKAARAEIVRLRERLAIADWVARGLRVERDAKELVIVMAVARVGGTVEGAPTHRGNFLQRIDELRKIEGRLARSLRWPN